MSIMGKMGEWQVCVAYTLQDKEAGAKRIHEKCQSVGLLWHEVAVKKNTLFCTLVQFSTVDKR